MFLLLKEKSLTFIFHKRRQITYRENLNSPTSLVGEIYVNSITQKMTFSIVKNRKRSPSAALYETKEIVYANFDSPSPARSKIVPTELTHYTRPSFPFLR